MWLLLRVEGLLLEIVGADPKSTRALREHRLQLVGKKREEKTLDLTSCTNTG
ncbi:hypothetical protein HanIR_Chr10g0461531 [Helianthus annuus]|nr:hypothetical protein HanIR_Chr10g0461531 [Helianthus annuus]